jgi:hypothetical protein
MKTLIICDSENNYRSWRVNMYPNGDRVPKDKGNRPTVAFFDLSHKETFGNDGQFVSEYYVDTVLGHKGALILYDDKYERDSWTVHGEAMTAILAWLREVTK